MMEKKHRCKLCFRNFTNGRALGGHMRSHMMKLYAEERTSKQEQGEEEEEEQLDDIHSYSSTSSPPPPASSSDDEEEDEESEEVVKGLLSYELRENPRKSTVLMDHEFPVVVQDRESETESSKKKICRRSERVRKSRISDSNRLSMNGFFQVKRPKFNHEFSSMAEAEPSSSISDTTPEEHVAHCLIMLSKDKWDKEETKLEEEEEEEEDYSQDSGVAKVIKTKVRGKYKCEACNKLFRSYQALGGHRASHNKIKASTTSGVAEESGGPAAAAVVEEKIHQCPFCQRIFSSGQALGGHKRSHLIGGSPISTNFSNNNTLRKKSRNAETLKIDLNLPAPIDDDETSQIAVSAVSDAEFV